MSTKPTATTLGLPKPADHHYFASNAFAWGTGDTRDLAIAECARRTGKDLIKQAVKQTGGIYVWSCRVDSATRSYDIEYYKPVGVPLAAGRHHAVYDHRGLHRGAPITERQSEQLDVYPHLVQTLRDCLLRDDVSSDELGTMIKNVLARAGVVL